MIYGVSSQTTTTTTGGVEDEETTFRFLHPKFKTNSGYRLAAAVELPCECWEFGAIFTYLPSHARSSFVGSSASDNLNFATFDSTDFYILNSLDDTDAYFLKSNWNSKTSYLDLDVGKSICLIEDCLNVRPHIGVRMLWLNQHFSVDGSGEVEEGVDPADAFQISLNQRMFGCGLEGGLWTDWQIGCGFSIIGHAGGSILCSNFRNSGKFSVTETDFIESINYRDHVLAGTPTLDFFLGLQYATCLCDSEVTIRAG